MRARADIMARVCLRYKGAGLSHEVILISYALIHRSACQPAAGPPFPARLRQDVPGRSAPPRSRVPACTPARQDLEIYCPKLL